MSNFTVLSVSATALNAQRQRMNVIASNLANIQSTRSEDGGPYKKREVVFSATPVQAGKADLSGVRVDQIVEDTASPKIVYDPSHPDADKDGNVAVPNINVIEEMVNMMMAYRAYEASISAFNTSKSMFTKTLELGRQ